MAEWQILPFQPLPASLRAVDPVKAGRWPPLRGVRPWQDRPRAGPEILQRGRMAMPNFHPMDQRSPVRRHECRQTAV